jgi:hypothetical protein
MMLPAMTVAWWILAVPASGLPGFDADPAADEAAVAGAGERVKPKLISPAMVAAAQSFIHLPLGAERYARVGDRLYVFVLERHYHPPGTVGAPEGWHKGVTMYELR